MPLDALVATHLEKRLLNPKRLEEVLSTVLDRRQERSERKQHHIAELNKRATETDMRLNRLYDAIECGVANLDDPELKTRIATLKATRDQARTRAQVQLVARLRELPQRAHGHHLQETLPSSPALPRSLLSTSDRVQLQSHGPSPMLEFHRLQQ